MKEKCGFDMGQCDNNCSACAAANFMFKVLEKSQKEQKEKDERYKKLLNNSRS